MSADPSRCGDAAAYALGALSPSEAETFREHLATCAICQDELAAFRAVADALPLSAPQLRPPAGLRRRVIRSIRAQPRAASAPLGRRSSTLGIARIGSVAAVAAVLALAVFGAIQLFSGGSGTRTIQASVVGSPGSAELRVAGTRAELILHRFPAPPAGHIYEVWLQRAGAAPAPTSALFSVTRAGAGDVAVPGTVRGVSEVLVTPEPDGGSLKPTHAPVIVAQLS